MDGSYGAFSAGIEAEQQQFLHGPSQTMLAATASEIEVAQIYEDFVFMFA